LSPQLALFLVTVCVLIILRIEYKKSGISSVACWVISIWLVYSGSKGIGVFLNIKTTIEAGSAPDRYFLLFIGLVGIFILLKRRFQWGLTLKRNWLFVLIIAYMLLSVMWARVPAISFRRWGREAISLIMIFTLISEESPIESFLSAFKRAIYIYLPFSILLIKYFSTYGRLYNRWTGEVQWVGLASQKNGLCIFCAFSCLFLTWLLWQNLLNWKMVESKPQILIDALMLILSIYIMIGPKRVLTYSATSFISLLVGLSLMIIIRPLVTKGIKLEQRMTVLLLIIIFISVLMPFSGEIPIKNLPQLLGRTENLTGRTDIWNSLLPYAKSRFLLGYGYGGFWTTFLREQIASHAHNGSLNTVLDLGIIGLILFIVFLAITTWKCCKLIKNESSVFILFLSMIFLYSTRNIAEIAFGEFISISGVLIAFISFIVNDEISKVDKIDEDSEEHIFDKLEE
jgi:O-antigen ligase